MKLLYKTRGNATPQGKPRVYFTGHPEDLSPYFDEITDDILKIQNCAIYYDAEPAADYDRDELLRELEQMQLLVIPVTSRFLFRRSRALEVEFPFAMECHIPVLPLIEESGLEEQFNRICGDLQMLDKNKRDDTALPYQEKLEKFLTSVLVGDKLAEKVRAAFDAYVFLSYRKKDRRYAQELMRLIHKNEFCRDIAIWYDEFLTPGENFNEAIATALEKCGLFALAVTPSVVEENNYVMTVEYPEAVKSGKHILPVELAPTDKEALRTCFQGLPPCTDAHDEGALSGALLEAVRKLAIRENDGSPEHNFFIGLAYLNGIDVEVDRGRALSLISGAAEEGLPEAMEKLVSMYRGGDGVERDYREAIRWQERLTGYWQKRFEESQTEADGLEWVSALWDLGDYWKELAVFLAANDAYQQMSSISKRLADRFGSADSRRDLAVSYHKLGDISQAEGRLPQTREYYLQALEVDKRLCEERQTADAKRNLTISYERLGDISQAEGRLSQAREYHLQALEIRKQLCEERQTVLARSDLAISYSNLGRISEAEGQLTAAKEYYALAMEIRRQLSEEIGTVEARRSLSIYYNNLGRISEAEGQLTAAKEYYEQALEIDRQLSEETGTVEVRRNLSISYNSLGGIREAQGQLIAAKEYYEQALEIRRQLCEEAQTVRARKDLADSYDCLGRICETDGRLPQAREYYLKALEIDRQLSEETKTVEARRNLSVSYNNLGDISEAEGETAQAEDYFLQALEIRRQLCEETQTVQAKRDLCTNCERLGGLCQTEGRLTEAKYYYEQALEIAEPLCEETQTVTAKRDLSVLYSKLGRVSEDEGRLTKARSYYFNAHDIVRQLSKETQTAVAQKDLVLSHNRLAEIDLKQGDLLLAENHFNLAMTAAKKLYRMTGTSDDYDTLATASFNTALLSSGELKKMMLQKAYNIWSELSGKYPDNPLFSERREAAKSELDQLKG